MSERGLFIALEGMECAGVTTQTQMLAARLRRAGRRVHTIQSPSHGPAGTLIRMALTGRLTLAGREDSLPLLIAADRADILAAEVVPKLEQGFDVLADRYLLSDLVHFAVPDEGENHAERQRRLVRLDWIKRLNEHALRPDIMVVLQVHPKSAVERQCAFHGGDPKSKLFKWSESDGRFHGAIAQAYARADDILGISEGGKGVLHVKADGDALETSTLIAQILPVREPPAETPEVGCA